MRNAFGALIVSPDDLTREERVDILCRLSGRLLADDSREARWLGGRLDAWLRDGGRLDAALGVVPARGSHRTPQALIRRNETDTLLMRLSTMAGGDVRALEILRGERPCPVSLADLLAQLKAMNAPTSSAAIHRARRRVSRQR